MSATVTLKQQVDLPVWEWLRFTPLATAAATCSCADESSGGRFIYFMGTADLYRYDTVTDAWQRLQGPGVAPLTASAMRYCPHDGYRGRIISATGTTAVIPALSGNQFVNKTIRITEGTGIGQERVISAVSDPVIAEFGVISAVGTSGNTITDVQTALSTKKWLPNQWRGYQCRIVFGTGISQCHKIVSNTIDTLVFSVDNQQAYEHWNNVGHSIIAPYALPVAGSHYYIESQTVTVPAWTTNPDGTSKFVIETGALWMITGRALVNGAAIVQYYDIAADTWYYKQCAGGEMGALLTGEVVMDCSGDISGGFDNGTVASAAARTLTCTGKTWTNDQWTGFSVWVTNTTTGVVQRAAIIGNTADTLYIVGAWTEGNPANPHTFVIQGDRNLWITGNNQAALYKYLVEEDLWTDSRYYDHGITADLSCRFGKQIPWHYTGAVTTSGIASVNSTPTAPGSGYRVGDISSVNEATGGQVRVTAVNASGGVTAVELYSGYNTAGTYTTGSGKATTAVYPSSGGGTGLTVNITAGNVGRLTTVVNHIVKPGEPVTLAGATVGGWNGTFTVLCAPSSTTIQISPPNATPPVASYANGTALIVDPSKNWTINEHTGKLVKVFISSINPTLGSPATQTVRITSNTATTLTIPAITAFTTGTYRYMIKSERCFGGDQQERVASRESMGRVTTSGSNSATVLVDATKAWATSQWVGYKLRVIAGTGFDKGEVAITANDATTLTSAGWGFTPDSTTKYEIMDSYGVCTSTFGTVSTLIDSTKNWPANIWTNKRVRINAGAGMLVETIVLSNTSNTLTVTASSLTQPTATTYYSILGCNTRGVGSAMIWNHGQTGADKGKYLYSAIGAGNNTFDRYNVATGRWDYAINMTPTTEPIANGTYFVYDNADRIYFCPFTGNRIFYLDLNTRRVMPAGSHPYAHGTAVQGNRMDIVTTVDGLKFLYLMRASGQEYWRTLLFW